jgi:hypothetical protein
MDISLVSHRAGLHTAQKVGAQFLLLVIVPLFLGWGKNTRYLDIQISNLVMWNLCNPELNIRSLISVYVKSVIGTVHMQGRDTIAHAHRKKKIGAGFNVKLSFKLSDVNKNGDRLIFVKFFSIKFQENLVFVYAYGPMAWQLPGNATDLGMNS